MISTVGDIDLHWEACGEGEPLVFLHGRMGCGADWRPVFSQPPEGAERGRSL